MGSLPPEVSHDYYELSKTRSSQVGRLVPVEMADILSFNLTQTNSGEHKPRKMNDPDLSTKLKLMGVDVSTPTMATSIGTHSTSQVASFGDFFADKRMQERMKAEEAEKARAAEAATQEAVSTGKKPPVWELNTNGATSLKIENENQEMLPSAQDK